ncbi:MAG: DotI/IcmL/TraM family protein [Gammaproteobacteria bacterium]|nr:DotI/IcmL/TraM family protein [Gammaproteobacteria bacterium]
MAEAENHVVELRDDFYRDSFSTLLFIIAGVSLGIFFLIVTSIYLYLDKPVPVTFAVGEEWRVQPPVPLNQPYLSTPEVLQWTADALRRSFVYDFKDYNDQLKVAQQYFTPDGWQSFQNQLNIYASYNNVQTYKLFVTGTPTSAPTILDEGLLSGRYAWKIQLPIMLNYSGATSLPPKALSLQVWVVRVSTLNNLLGVAIDNVQVDIKGTGNPATGSG